MSFSKAKIQRFNELASPAPPPGAYDPNYIAKIKKCQTASVIKTPSSKKVLSDPASPAASPAPGKCTVTVGRTKFRTPRVPTRRRSSHIGTRTKALAMKGMLTPTGQKLTNGKSNRRSKVAELAIECENSNKVIHEHEKNTGEMKLEMGELSKQLEELKEKYTAVEQLHKEDIEIMAQVQQEVNERKDEKYQAEIDTLRAHLADAFRLNEEESEKSHKVISELKERIKCMEAELAHAKERDFESFEALVADRVQADELNAELQRSLDFKEMELSVLSHQLDVVESELAETVKSNADEASKNNKVMNELKERINYLEAELMLHKNANIFAENVEAIIAAKDETDELNVKLNRTLAIREMEMTVLRNELADMETELTEALKTNIEEAANSDKVVNDLKNKVNSVELQYKEMAELNEELQSSLNIKEMELKTLQDTLDGMESELKVKQNNEDNRACLTLEENRKLTEELKSKDLEISRLTETIETLKSEAETQESFSRSLQEELDRAEAELGEKKDALRIVKDQMRADAAEMVARRRRMDVVMAEYQASVAALTARLAQSEAEVERLNFKDPQERENVQEQPLSLTCNDTSREVQGQRTTIAQKVHAEVQHTDEMDVQLIADIKAMKGAFDAKIHDLKTLVRSELNRAQDQCFRKSEEIAELQFHNCRMNDEITAATHLLLKLEETNDEHVIQISKLQLENEKLQSQLDRLKKIEESNEPTISAEKTEVVEEESSSKADQQTEWENAEALSQNGKSCSKEHLEGSDQNLSKEEERDDKTVANNEKNDETEDREIVENQSVRNESEMEVKITALATELKRLYEANVYLEEEKLMYEQERIRSKTLETAFKEELDKERAQREKLERDVQELEGSRDKLKAEIRFAADRFAEMYEEQNKQKMKLKCISHLKETIEDQQKDIQRLRQELDTKTVLIEQLSKAGDQMRSELRQLSLGKENVHVKNMSSTSPRKSLITSFSKSANATPISSPKHLTPLRNRNE